MSGRVRIRAGLALLAVLGSSGPLAAQSGGNGTLYMATYDDAVYVVDEASLEVRSRIDTQSGIPVGLLLSQDRTRLYAIDATAQTIETLDLASERSIDSFTLSEGRTQVRINGFQVSPDHGYAVLVTRAYTKGRDRYEVGASTILRVDLTSKAVTDTIPWPDEEERTGARMMFSPDGALLYLFGDDIVALETEGFTEVDRWTLSEPLEPGFGRFGFGFPMSLYESPGIHTGLFRVTDPVQNRRLMGIARVDMAARDVDFYTLGPSEPVGFTLAPDGRKAYGLFQRIGRYEFWTFDLEGRRVERREPFAGRPRMGLLVSTNGELLYVLNAGNTVDVYDADTYEHLRQAQFDADMISYVLVPPGP